MPTAPAPATPPAATAAASPHAVGCTAPARRRPGRCRRVQRRTGRPVINVRTDVLDVDVSLRGGELQRADLLAVSGG